MLSFSLRVRSEGRRVKGWDWRPRFANGPQRPTVATAPLPIPALSAKLTNFTEWKGVVAHAAYGKDMECFSKVEGLRTTRSIERKVAAFHI